MAENDPDPTRTESEPELAVAPEVPPKRSRRRRLLKRVVIGLIVLFGLIQLVPYGHDWTNPPVTRAVEWPDATSENIARGACFDCHSNLTDWWWATKVAPSSWLVANDVSGGRKNLNFSEWDRPQPSVDDVVKMVSSGDMPPLQYKLIHGSARLSGAQRDQLAAAIREIYAKDPPPIRAGG